jgi:hypothetical protein
MTRAWIYAAWLSWKERDPLTLIPEANERGLARPGRVKWC